MNTRTDKFKALPPEEQKKFLKWLEAAMGPKAVEQFKEKKQIQGN